MPPDTSHKRVRGRSRPLILVTNDDGLRAQGLRRLAAALRVLGRVVIVAPDQQRSAASHSITLHRPLRLTRMGADMYAVDGTPTDCVMLAVHEILRVKPDLIASGINHGANLGDDVHYSGTVSAAFEGGILGIPSMAVSLAGNGGMHFVTAGLLAQRIAKKMLQSGLPRGIILNVNVPDLPAGEVRGTRITRQGKRNYGGIIVEKLDPRGKKYYWIGGDEAGFEDVPQSDCNAVREGFASITPLRVNLTDRAAAAALLRWHLAPTRRARGKRSS
jgi:5'/3'-nucleotidase